MIPFQMSENVLVFITNEEFSKKCLKTIRDCRTIGNYTGDIVVLVEKESEEFADSLEQFGAILRNYKPIDVSPIVSSILATPFSNTDGRELKKLIQWQKLHVFDTYFKQWKKIFYMDAGMHVMGDINIFFEVIRPNTVLAHCDDYPEYKTTLADQFDKSSFERFKELSESYSLQTSYQTGILLFESSIIKPDTIQEIMKLAYKYPISRTNEQGILNLYFKFSQVPIFRDGKFLYDYWERFGNTRDKYILLKYPKT